MREPIQETVYISMSFLNFPKRYKHLNTMPVKARDLINTLIYAVFQIADQQ